MDDKWKDSGYDPQKAWDEVTRPQREEKIRAWAEKKANGNQGLQMLWLVLTVGGFVACVVWIIFALVIRS